MKTIEELLKSLEKKPETLSEKIKDIWFDLSYYYPQCIKRGWWAVKRFCRNLRRYWGILWEDNDFDMGYFEELLLTKLTWMSKYFRTARIIVGEERYYSQINLALRIGKIAFERDLEEENPEGYGGKYGCEYLGYVNTKNYMRFWPSISSPQAFQDSERLGGMHKTELRRLKAKYLFYRILDQYSECWSD